MVENIKLKTMKKELKYLEKNLLKITKIILN